MDCSRSFVVTLMAAVCLTATGCMKWKAPWDGAGVPKSSPSTAEASLEAATKLSAVADGREAPEKAIEAYEAVLATDPDHTAALIAVADHSADRPNKPGFSGEVQVSARLGSSADVRPKGHFGE